MSRTKSPAAPARTQPGKVQASAPRPDDRRGHVERSKIKPSPTNPRKTFPPESLADLAASIQTHGLLSPLLVRPLGKFGRGRDALLSYGGDFELVDGERRFRASGLAGLGEVPVVVRELTDAEVLALQIVANEQREDVPPSEQAAAYRRLHDAGQTAEQIARAVGRKVPYVRSMLALGRLPLWMLAAVDGGRVPRETAGLVARVPGAETRKRAAAAVLIGYRHLRDVSDEDLEALDAGTDDAADYQAMSYREAKEFLRTHCTQELKGAPFSRTKLYVVPGCEPGHERFLEACDPCPSRAGNDPDAVADKVRGDVCLNPDCYRQKVEAYRASEMEKAAAKGVQPVPDGFAWPLSWGQEAPPKGWCLLDVPAVGTELRDEWPPGKAPQTELSKVLGAECPPKYLAFGRDGTPRLLVKTADARRSLIAGGVIPRPEPRKKSPPPARPAPAANGTPSATIAPKGPVAPPKRREPAAWEVDDRACQLALGTLAEVAAGHCEGLAELPDAGEGRPVLDALRLIARLVACDWRQVGDDGDRDNAIRRTLRIPDDVDAGELDEAVGPAAEKLSAGELLGAVLAMTAWPLVFQHRKDPLAVQVLDWAEVDVDEFQERARRELNPDLPAEDPAAVQTPAPTAARPMVGLAAVDGIPDAVLDALVGLNITTLDTLLVAVETYAGADAAPRTAVYAYLTSLRGINSKRAGAAADAIAEYLDAHPAPPPVGASQPAAAEHVRPPLKGEPLSALGLTEKDLEHSSVVAIWGDHPSRIKEPVRVRPFQLNGRPHVWTGAAYGPDGDRWECVPLWLPEEFRQRHPGIPTRLVPGWDNGEFGKGHYYAGVRVLVGKGKDATEHVVGTKGEQRALIRPKPAAPEPPASGWRSLPVDAVLSVQPFVLDALDRHGVTTAGELAAALERGETFGLPGGTVADLMHEISQGGDQ